MEKPRIVEHLTDHCAETRRRIAAYIVGKLEALDDNLYHLGDAFDEDTERLVTPEELAELDDEKNIERGRE